MRFTRLRVLAWSLSAGMSFLPRRNCGARVAWMLCGLFAGGRLEAGELMPLPAGVTLQSDVPFLAADRAERLDLYLPAGPADGPKRPAVVYLHGGGWVRGDKATDRERNIGGHFAAAGYVFVSANYLLGPKAWPQNLLDGKNAIRFLRAQAARYHVDPRRIAVMGTSAGGHLAMMAAYTAGHPDFEPASPYPGVASDVCAVVNFYGITNLLSRRAVEPDGTPTGRFYDSNAPEVLGVSRTENPARWRQASPVSHLSRTSPPTLIVHGLSDPTVDYLQAVELANGLRAQGVVHELLLLEGIGHMFHFDAWQDQPMPAHVRPAVLAFLARHLAETK